MDSGWPSIAEQSPDRPILAIIHQDHFLYARAICFSAREMTASLDMPLAQ
jgi:hypothetical protein